MNGHQAGKAISCDKKVALDLRWVVHQRKKTQITFVHLASDSSQQIY